MGFRRLVDAHKIEVRSWRGQSGISGEHQVHMVRHDCVGERADRVLLGKVVDRVHEPASSVLEVLARVLVDPVQEGPAHAA